MLPTVPAGGGGHSPRGGGELNGVSGLARRPKGTRNMTADIRAPKSKGELEAAVCNLVNRFHRDITGRGPRQITATIQDGTVYIRLQGVLTVAEERLVAGSPSPQDGTELVRQMRDRLIRTARSALLEALAGTLGQEPETMMHDVAPQADEEMFVFNLPREQKAVRRRA